jgi:hypothetical protein
MRRYRWVWSAHYSGAQGGGDRIFPDRIQRRSRNIDRCPEPTWEGVLRRWAEFPLWTYERLMIDSVNSRAANPQATLEYLSAGRKHLA